MINRLAATDAYVSHRTYLMYIYIVVRKHPRLCDVSEWDRCQQISHAHKHTHTRMYYDHHASSLRSSGMTKAIGFGEYNILAVGYARFTHPTSEPVDLTAHGQTYAHARAHINIFSNSYVRQSYGLRVDVNFSRFETRRAKSRAMYLRLTRDDHYTRS